MRTRWWSARGRRPRRGRRAGASGWQVTLLERAERVRRRPTALVIWPNGVRALQALGLGGGLAAIADPVAGRRGPPPGRAWLARSPGPMAGSDRPPVVVHPEDLHDALMAGLGDRVEIRTGVDGAPPSAASRASGRRSATAGTPSRRTWWSPPTASTAASAAQLAPESRLVSSGCTAWRAVIPWYRAPRLPDGPAGRRRDARRGYRFVAASLGERGSSGGSTRGGIYWVATAAGAPRPEPPATQLALLRRWFAGWPAPVGELLEATDPDDLVQQEVRELRPLPRAFGFPVGPGGWCCSATRRTPCRTHLGQGACLAFEDAATLASLVREARLPDASRRRTTGCVRARGRTVVRQTRRMSAVLQARGRLALRARDAALGTINSRPASPAAAADRRPVARPPT